MNNLVLIQWFKNLFVLILFITLTGCLEASFELDSSTRPPKWFDMPTEMKRSDLRVTMDYHSTFSGGEYVFKFYNKNKFFKLQKISVTTNEQPTIRTKALKNSSGKYPAYNVITVNGITDVVERRKMEPIFYMTDDPKVWKELVFP